MPSANDYHRTFIIRDELLSDVMTAAAGRQVRPLASAATAILGVGIVGAP
jgi:hypothetical protein